MLVSISPKRPKKESGGSEMAMDRGSPEMCFDPAEKDGSWKTRLLSDEPLGLLSYPVKGPVVGHIGCSRMSPEMRVAGRDQRDWKRSNRGGSLLDIFGCKFKSWNRSDPNPTCTPDGHLSRNLLFGGGGDEKCLEVGIMSSSAKELLLGDEEGGADGESDSTYCRCCCSSHDGYFSGSQEGEPDRAVIKTREKRGLMMKRFLSLVAVLSSFLFLLVILLEQSYVRPDHESSEAQNLASRIKRLPHCIIIGARKCGTRALIDMLNLHPQVEKAALEVHFFDRDDNYAKGLEWYREHMPECREDQIGIEKSPSYFITPEVPERIHAMNSSIKLLLIVREPVTRVISDYTQIYGTNAKTHNGSKSPRLEELVLQGDGSINVQYKAIRISLYSRYLQRWLDVFPSTQIHVIDGDALIRDPYSQLRDVERFLGLEPRLQRDNFYFNSTKGFYCWRKLSGGDVGNNETGLHCLNDSKGRRHPPVDRYIVSRLRQFYNPHNLKFYDMVGRDFGWPEK